MDTDRPSVSSAGQWGSTPQRRSPVDTESPPTRRFRSPIAIDPSHFPTRSQCDCLVDNYLQSYQPVSPLVHVPTFMLRYHQFWEVPKGDLSTSHPHPAFISLLYAVLLAGAVCVSTHDFEESFGEQTRSMVTKELYTRTGQALRQAGYTKTPSLDSFTAFLISESIWLRGEFLSSRLCRAPSLTIVKMKSP